MGPEWTFILWDEVSIEMFGLKNIEAYEEEKALTMTQMSQALTAIGVDLDSNQLEAMMSSVVGDDIVSMSVVFNAIKDMTTQLAELTQSSGEDLAHAKKYYGIGSWPTCRKASLRMWTKHTSRNSLSIEITRSQTLRNQGT